MSKHVFSVGLQRELGREKEGLSPPFIYLNAYMALLCVMHCAKCFTKINSFGSSHRGSVVTSPTSIREDMDVVPGLAQW